MQSQMRDELNASLLTGEVNNRFFQLFRQRAIYPRPITILMSQEFAADTSSFLFCVFRWTTGCAVVVVFGCVQLFLVLLVFRFVSLYSFVYFLLSFALLPFFFFFLFLFIYVCVISCVVFGVLNSLVCCFSQNLLLMLYLQFLLQLLFLFWN